MKQQLAYNDRYQKITTLRHLFLPSPTGLLSEAVVAVGLLGVSSLGAFNQALELVSNEGASPVSYTAELSASFWNKVNDIYLLQQISLFIMWAVFGMIAYVSIFKLVQFTMTSIFNIKEDVDFIKADKNKGIRALLISLKFAVSKLLVILIGFILVIVGVAVCFAYALAQAKTGIATFPDNLVIFGYAFVAAFLAVRLFMIGACFLSPSLRSWYSTE